MTIYFDMDGTIADLYGVNGWLQDLINSDVRPYRNAKPLVDMDELAMVLNALQILGFKIGIISWLSRSGSPAYNQAVTEIKREWLKKHLPTVHFDEINIVEYGYPKTSFCKDPHDVLFDDEVHNRERWGGYAYDEKCMMSILRQIFQTCLKIKKVGV